MRKKDILKLIEITRGRKVKLRGKNLLLEVLVGLQDMDMDVIMSVFIDNIQFTELKCNTCEIDTVYKLIGAEMKSIVIYDDDTVEIVVEKEGLPW